MKGLLPKGVLTMIIGAACLLALGAVLISGRLGQPTVSQYWAGTVAIDGETVIDAGTPAEIRITTEARDGTNVQLGVFAPVSTVYLETQAAAGQAIFTITEDLTRHAGIYRIVAQVEDSTSLVHVLEVRPLTAVDPVVPLIGPRTIIADGSDFTMTVVSPSDQFGNPVADDTAVDIELLRPNETRTIVTETVQRAIAALLIESTTETGRLTVSASVADADGPSNTVDQVAGTPATFTIEADDRNALADGFALHAVQTSELRDQFGNLLPDGVSVVFVVTDSEGTSFIQSTVQGGFARAQIEAPSEAGEVTASARVSGAQSIPLVIPFAPAVSDFDAQLHVLNNAPTIAVGPVLTVRGGYVPDGTEVTIRDAATDEVLATAALRGGSVDVPIDEVTGELTASVLGLSTKVRDQ